MDKPRCPWANPQNPLYLSYHDTEWGVPTHDDDELFERLCLENFQVGLSWELVLNRRAAMREAFDGFKLDKVINYDEAKITELLANPKILRNRRKIEAVIHNAHVFKQIQTEFGSFDAYLRSIAGDKIIYETGLTTSPLSDKLAADLKKRGMKFIGSLVAYAYLQSTGVIYGHEKGCFLYRDPPET